MIQIFFHDPLLITQVLANLVKRALLDFQCATVLVNTIPGEHLCRIFRRMLADLRNNTNGLPDLILFSGNSYQLVEIKGPGDKLQKNQTRWFEFFRQENIPASVANVEYSL